MTEQNPEAETLADIDAEPPVSAADWPSLPEQEAGS